MKRITSAPLTAGSRRLIACVGFAALSLVNATPVAAQYDILPAPARPIAASDDATALRVNPALLAWAPDRELRVTTHFDDVDTDTRWRGLAAGIATRLPFLNWGAALGFDTISPRRGGTQNWLSAALALPMGHSSAVGLSLHSSYSAQADLDDLTSLAVGYAARPSDYFALAATGKNLFSPSNGYVTLLPVYGLGSVIRPLGTRGLELGLEANYTPRGDTWTPRTTLGVDLPGFGRFRGDLSVIGLETDEPAWVASAGLSLFVNGMNGSLETSAGTLYANAGNGAAWGAYAGLSAKRFREPIGWQPGRYAVRLRLEQTPSTRGHMALLAQLWSLADEANVDAVVLELRASPAESLAHLEELRDALFELRRAGKRTLCHIEDGNGAALFLCAAATRTLINPAGSVRFAGIRSRGIYFAQALKNLGIEAEFVRIGAHKSAPEQYTERQATDVANQDRIDLLQHFERGFTEALAAGHNLSFAQVRERMAQGPFDANSAKELGFVDQLAFDDEIPKAVKTATGRDTPLLADQHRRRAPVTFGNGGALAIIHVDGEIIDGRGRNIPFIGSTSAGSYTLADTLKAVRENDQIKAVVVRVDSPGGSSTAADVIWRQVVLTAKVKPTVVSMGSAAASGGYYLSAGATRIFANPLTITGSIGIYYLKANLSGLLAKVGIDHQTYTTQNNADSDSFFRAFTEEEREEQQERIGRFYQLFLNRVASGRKLSVEAVDKVAQGRVWTGEQALTHGLVDELGGLRQAIEYAKTTAGLDADCPTVTLPTQSESLLGRLLGIPGMSTTSEALAPEEASGTALPPLLTQPLEALVPLLWHAPLTPLARLEFHLEPLR